MRNESKLKVVRKIRDWLVYIGTAIGIPIWGIIILLVGWREPWFVIGFALYIVAAVTFIYDKIREKGIRGFVERTVELVANFVGSILEALSRSD